LIQFIQLLILHIYLAMHKLIIMKKLGVTHHTGHLGMEKKL
jgi:hypothetical protein